MRKLLFIASLALTVCASLALTAGTASAAGEFTSITPRYGVSPQVHYRIRYDVWPGPYQCIPDEWGYTDCFEYDGRYADIDVRVFRTKRSRRWLVHHEVVSGSDGRASLDLYGWQLNQPLRARSGTKLSYRIVFRLIDPMTDRVVQIVNRYFRTIYR